MTTSSASAIDNSLPARQQDPLGVRLTGPWLVLARMGWVVVVALNVALSVASIPAYNAALHQVIATSQPSQLPDFGGPLTPSVGPRGLEAVGLSLDFYATWNVALSLLLLLVSLATGAIIFWRGNNDRMALLASFTLALFPTTINTDSIASLPAYWTLPVELLHFLGEVSFGLFFFLFPNGRFVPRWTRWLAVVVVAYWAVDVFWSDIFNASLGASLLSFVLFLGLLSSYLAIQIYRYRRVSTPLERQQTKWVVWGLAVGLGGSLLQIVVVFAVLPVFLHLDAPVFLFGNTIQTVLTLLFPICIGVASLRYRLWDIDVIINRTLVYGSLTVVLAAVYFACVLGAQALVTAMTRQTEPQPVIIVASTLLIAALFTPLRRRIQGVIDQRFYRQKYDAATTLAAFSASLRSEVELGDLQTHLLDVIAETMHPAHVSMWLSPEVPARPVPVSERQSVEQTDGGME